MTRRILYPAAYLAVAAAAMSIQVVGARQNAVQIDRRRHRRRRHEQQGTGGGRLGHRRDQGPADRVQPQRRHRRSRAGTSIPDLPKANYQVFVRGYGLVGLADRVQAAPGKILNLTADDRSEPERRRAVLPGELLVRDAQHPRQERVPDPGAGRHGGREPGGVPQAAEDRRLRVVPSARQQADARDHPRASARSSPPKRRGPSA